MEMTPVNAAPVMPRNPFLVLRDPEWSEAQGNLQNWTGVLIIAHVLVFAGFLKIAELYHPHLIPKADAICLILRTLEKPGQSSGNGSAAPTSGQLIKQHKSVTPSPSTPRTLPTHQLKNAPVPTPTRISNILPVINAPHPVWTLPEGVQQTQNAPEAESNSVAGGVTSTKGNAGSEVSGRDTGTRTGTGNGQARSGSPGSGNIGPYRKHLLVMLSRKWKPTVSPADVILRLKIGRTGELLSAVVYQSSGNPKAESEALRAANSVKYPPLPSWFGGQNLTFQIELASAGTKK